MCGILGIHDPRGLSEEAILEKAIGCISYRGPDAGGIFISEDKTIGLAHKRLSIIDLSEAGNQPMCDVEKKLWIVFNGEIYNFKKIKEILTKDGYSFVSTSDTEVLLYSFKKWGKACLKYVNGMFSFGIYDSQTKKIFLARDRTGEKPLFYSFHKGKFIFASELKAIQATGLVPSDIDMEAVNYYFALGYIPGDMCINRNVRKLPPGHFLEFDIQNRDYRIIKYWDAPVFDEARDEATATEEIEGLLIDAVRLRLISDVPLGVFLSGGVDSSLIAALMRKVHNGEIKTFSVGFEGSKRNELKYARIVAKHLETTHTEFVVKRDFRNDLEHISGLLDEPICDSSLLPTYYLSKFARQTVKVALSGDGGDELFGGYIYYKSAMVARNMAMLAVPPMNKLSGFISSLMPEGLFGKNTLYGIFHGGKSCFSYPTQIFKADEREKLFTKTLLDKIKIEAPVEYREKMMDKNYDFINQMCYADLKTFLADDILVKVDRASMFSSLEVRCPMLDYRLVEYAFGHIPGNLKIKNGKKKYLLKKLAKIYLPEDLDIERKQGFDIPSDLLKRTYLTDRLLSFPRNEFISGSYIEQLVNSQRSGQVHLWSKLFALYFFLRWLEIWEN